MNAFSVICSGILSLAGNSNQQVSDEKLSLPPSGCISCTTFNILAPIYKRLGDESRESHFRDLWLKRNREILDRLLNSNSSIICLQEFWVTNKELVKLYEESLREAGYVTYTLGRTNNRGDGLLTAVRQSEFRVLNYREIMFEDMGDRVAQLLHVELLVHLSQDQFSDMANDVLVVNTHIIFPHDFSYCFLRLQQVYKILQFVESYRQKCKLPPIPVILCGDWNGSKKGNVYKFLLSQGFASSYDIFRLPTENGEDYKWISHLNHRGNLCAVDFIWLRNPEKPQYPLKQSFIAAILGNIYYLRCKAPTKGVYLSAFHELDGSSITFSQLSQVLSELDSSGLLQNSLSDEEIKEIWQDIDTDRDGLIDLSHFNVWDPSKFAELKGGIDENSPKTEEKLPPAVAGTTLGFTVNKAAFFPQEVEKGLWPENYSLSDHAQLTVEFSPVYWHHS